MTSKSPVMNIHVLPQAALILHADGQIDQANSLACDLFNESRTDFCSLNFAALLTQYDAGPFLTFLGNIHANQPDRWVAHLACKGTIRHIALNISRLPDSSLLALLDDITLRKAERSKMIQQINILDAQCRLSPIAMLLAGPESKIRSFNHAFQKMWDMPSCTKIGQDVWERIQGIADQVKAPERFSGIIQQVLNQHRKQINDTIELKDGRTFNVSTQPILEANIILGRVWYFQDMTALKKMQVKLDSQLIFQNGILEHIEDGIVACDANGELSMFNRASREMHGLHADVPAHELWVEHHRLFHADGITPLQPMDIPLIKALNGTQIKNEEMAIVRADGEKRDVQVSGQVMRGKNGEKMGAVISLHDITDIKRIREQLKELAYQDPLTGMPNRRLFHDLLDQALHQARRNQEKVGVLFLDLDNFKTVNDKLGHDIGDQLLVDLSTHLALCLRGSDIICRWGGDEFVVALPTISGTDDARLIAEKICASINQTVQTKYADCKVSTSIGIAIYPDHAEIPDKLIRCADKAMYEAKQQGKNRYCFAPLPASTAAVPGIPP